MSERGWAKIGPDLRIKAWADAALPLAKAALASSPEPWRCGGTWFVGVDALANDATGAVSGVGLPWDAFGLTPVPLHKAQLSTIRPGYPQPDATETPAAYRFRVARDAAHLDGLLPIGQQNRRMVKEPHAFILGLPLNVCGAWASPLVVWEGSHEIMRRALVQAFAGHNPNDFADIDITEAYQAARARVFETCRRIELPVQPGEATLLHRLTIHGVAPWQDRAHAPPEGRIIAYFRPLMPSVADWLDQP